MRKRLPYAWIFRTSLGLAAALLPSSVPAGAGEQLTATDLVVLEHPPIPPSGQNSAHCLVFLERDGLLASGAASGVFIWDLASGKLQRTLEVHDRGIDSLAVDPRGSFLVAGCASGRIKVWDTRTWKETRDLGPTTGAVRGLALSPDGTLLASAGPDGQKPDQDFNVIVWHLASGQKLRSLALPPPALGTTSLAFLPDGKKLLAGQDQSLWLWDVNTGQEIKRVRLEGVIRSLGSLALSPDGGRLATGIFEPRIRLWDTTSWQQQLAWEAHSQEKQPRKGVTCVAYSPDGKFLLSGGMDGRVGVWQPTTGQPLLQLDPMRANVRKWVTAVAMSADGTRVAAANMQGFVTIWRIHAK